MILDYIIKKPEDNFGEANNKEKYGNTQIVPGKEVIIINPYTNKPFDLSKKTVIMGFHADEKTGKNTGEK